MDHPKRPQVLLLGNGINRAFAKESWKDFLSDIQTNDKIPMNCEMKSPFPLQAIIATNDNITNALKDKKDVLFGDISSTEQRDFLNRILAMGFDHIITTNYSYELECVALKRNKVTESLLRKHRKYNCEDGITRAEGKYLLHTYYSVILNGIENKIWHIHGEAKNKDSIILGHYYYGKLLHKYNLILDKRREGYKNAQDRGEEYPIKSWLDAFILGDVYVLGFGYDLSEFDLWWLLNRKKREKAKVGKVHFFEVPNDTVFGEKIALMEAFGAVYHSLGFQPLNRTREKSFDGKSTECLYKEFYNKALDQILVQMKN